MKNPKTTAGGPTPAKAIECIAPSYAGGGWDFTCRQISKILLDIGQVDVPVKVTNLTGANGGLAFSTVVNERSEDADLIIAASSATTTQLAQNAYEGATTDQVRFVGAIGADPGVIAVPEGSPFQTLKELLDATIADPSAVSFAGGSATNGFDHLKLLQVLTAAGFNDFSAVNYNGAEGSADAIAQAIDGTVHAVTGDISEVVGSLETGEIRVLAVLTEKRVPNFDDIPTAMEQGYDVVAVNWRGFYVPKGISDEQFNVWAERLQTVADSPEWLQVMADNGLLPFTKVGEDFQVWVESVVASTEELSHELGIIQ